MAYRRNDSGTWWVTFISASGKRVRKSTGTTDRKEAEALEAKWKLEDYQIKKWDQPPPRSFDELMLIYLKATREEKRSAERDLYSAKHLYRAFSGIELGGLSPKEVRDYINMRREEGGKPGTINRELGLFSAAINYARKELEWEIPNPVQGRRLKEPEGRMRWLTHEQADSLIQAAEAQKRAPYLTHFIRLALNTGCRSGEILGLSWNRVDLERGIFYLAEEHTKNAKRRSIPLNATATGALSALLDFRNAHCPDSPWVFCHRDGSRLISVKKAFHNACATAGIEDFNIHDMRHTCASWLVTAGTPLPEVRDLLGHSTVKMTERYAHLSPDNVRAAVERLDSRSRSGHVARETTQGARE